MFKLLCVTNRALCREPFLDRIEAVAASGVDGIILREKEMTAQEYETLASDVMRICRAHDVLCILHSFVDPAISLHAEAIHLPFPVLRTLTDVQKAQFRIIGASCHSVEDAKEAQRLGCTYLTFGHVFATDCKKGVPPRGIDCLKDVCRAVSVPVFAIGGISDARIGALQQAGAQGACLMSSLMQCEQVNDYVRTLLKAGEEE